MKRKLRFIAAVAALLGLLAIAAVVSNPIYGKLLCGTARVLTKETPVAVQIDDHRLETVRCFAEPGKFGNQRSRGLVLWVDGPNAVLGRHILVVDLDHGQVLVPNSGVRNYKLLWNRWLIQSDSGATGVAFGDSKLDANDPNFQQSGHVISFTIPPVLDLPAGRWNLKIDTNERF